MVKSQGQVTDEISRFKTIIQENSERIRGLEEAILDLRTEFQQEKVKLQEALAKYRKNPKKDTRKDLQRETAISLERIAKVTGAIVNQREEVILGAMQVHSKSTERAAAYRSERETLDKSIPERQSQYERMLAENDGLKDEYLKDPTSEVLKRKLRQRYRAENLLELELKHDLRRMSLLKAAAEKLDNAGENVQRLADGLEATLDNIELVQLDCEQNAELLLELIEIEGEIETLTGGAEVGTLLTEVGELTDLSEELSATIGLAMDAFLEPDPVNQQGGPQAIPDTGFDRWLNSRSE